MSAIDPIASLCRHTLKLYLQTSIHTLTVSNICCQSCAGICIYYNIHSVILTILEDTIVELQEHRSDQEIVEAKGNRRKKWKALRQVPDADEGSSRRSNIGSSLLVSEAQPDQPNMAAINRPDSPPLAPRKSKRLKGEAPSHASVEKF